jgi:high-affinity nickel permease
MTWDSISVSNVFLAIIAIVNVVILAILYERLIKKSK